MNTVIPGIGMVFIELGDGAQAGNELLATTLVWIAQSITFGAGEYFLCNAWVRLVARRAAQSAQRQAGSLPVRSRLLIISAPAFSGLVLVPFRDSFQSIFGTLFHVFSAPAGNGDGPGSSGHAE